MLPASNRGKGENVGFPDVCRTPPPPGIPVPYTNHAPHALAEPFSKVVLISDMPALNVGSKIPKTNGDNPGVLHPHYTEEGTFVDGCDNIFIDGLPGVNLTTKTTHNSMNCTTGAHTVPNDVNVYYNYARREAEGVAGRPMTGDDAARLSSALRAAPPPSAALLPCRIGLLRVGIIAKDACARVYAALAPRSGARLDALVLDLRGSPGGRLDAAIRLAAEFLTEGDEIATIIDGDGDAQAHRAQRDGAYTMPLVVLVDIGTASAAELLAGALQARGRAVVVGERTAGKASAQAVVWTAGGAGLGYATVARCLLPGGASVDGGGLVPDVPAPGGAAPDIDATADPPALLAADAALRTAWEVARQLILPTNP
jgi:carboxyl-terminal processing protease